MVWSDPRLIELSSRFLPVAETQSRLVGTDSVSRWFRELAEKGHYAGEAFPTRQGIYICTADGELLASTKPTTPDSVAAVMRRGLEAWLSRASPTAPRPAGLGKVPAVKDVVPSAGLVLEVTMRRLDLDVGEGETPPIDPEVRPARFQSVPRPSNFDVVWFTREESLEWLPPRLEVGETRRLSKTLTERVVGLHLVDGVNSPLPARFRPDEVADSWIATEVVERDGNRVRIRITGETHARSRISRRRMPTCLATNLLGHASYNEVTGKFEAFDLVALGQWRQFRDLDDAAPIRSRGVGFVLTRASEAALRFPPYFLRFYGGEWANVTVD